jgi:hypothetical protein
MNSNWEIRLSAARGWIFGVAMLVAGVIWLVRH